MNKSQRNQLQAALDRVSPWCEHDAFEGLTADGRASLGEALHDLELAVSDLASEEREKFDNMPEGLQNSETGQKIEEAADILEMIGVPDPTDYDLTAEAGQGEFQSDLTDIVDELEELL